MSDLVFTTARLAMRDFRESDLERVIRMWGDPDVTRYMDDAPKSATESTEWLAQVIHHNRVRPREAYNLAITEPGVDHAIGWIGFGPSERDPSGGTHGVGYLLDSACWRRGYMSEVLTGVARFVFDDLAGTRIVAWCYADNVASARTLDKAGFSAIRKGHSANALEGAAVRIDYELIAEPPRRRDTAPLRAARNDSRESLRSKHLA